MNPNIILNEQGKPVFTGKEASPPVLRRESSKMTCPVCKAEVDYLLGNVRQGCEGCYDKSKDEPAKGDDTYDTGKEIL